MKIFYTFISTVTPACVNKRRFAKAHSFAFIGLFTTLALSRGDTTLTNQTDTVTYTSNTSANVGTLTMIGASTLTLDDKASVSVTDSTGAGGAEDFLGTSIGGAETIVAENSGPGNFVFNLGGIGRASGTGTTINYVESNTGGGTITLNSSARISHGGDGNDLTFWAFYNGNDWATTATNSGGAIMSAAAQYNDGGNDHTATNLSTWSANTFEDYTDDSAAAYSGALTANAEKHGVRIANAAGASLDLGGHQLIVAALLDAQGAGAATVSDGNLTATGLTNELIINQNNTANKMTVSAKVTGSGMDFAKSGVGTLVLNNATNDYTGATFINQGALQLDGTLTNTSKVILAQGATLSGAGTINSAVTAEGATSVINAGDPGQIGTLSLNALTATGGLTLDFTLDGEGTAFGTDSSFIDVGGLNLGGTIDVNFTTLDSIVTDTPYLLMAGNIWSGSPTFDFTTPAGYKVESYDYDAPDAEFTVEFEAVPEPSVFAMLLGGAGLLGLVLRRKRGQF